MRQWLLVGVLASSLTAGWAGLRTSPVPQQSSAESYVRLRIRPENGSTVRRVRLSYVVAPDSILAPAREMPVPLDLDIPGRTIRVQVEALNRAQVTTTTAEYWYGRLLVTRGEVTGVGAEIQVHQGGVAICTTARGVFYPNGGAPRCAA
jgi:predicted secreted hydrolase